jgi:hypothetical protein
LIDRIDADSVCGQPVAEPEPWDNALLMVSPEGLDGEVTFPMYAIPRPELLEFLASRGARTFFVEHDDRGGQEWEGFRYFIQK